IRANPGAMTWTWGDGTTTITYDRGNPYPNQTLTHTYAYFEGDVVITLTSTWSGEYSLDGGTTWRPAPGTARTDSTPIPLTVYNPHTHIVACDTNGNCRSLPRSERGDVRLDHGTHNVRQRERGLPAQHLLGHDAVA